MTTISRMTLRIALTGLVIATGFAAHAAAGEGEGKGGKMRHERLSFSTLDTNSDGQLTREEMAAQAKVRFDTADTNGDGMLSAQEMGERGGKRAEKRAAKMIERHDSNDDGQISFEEMSGGKQEERMTKMFDRLDADDDGSLSEEEFAKMSKRGDKRMKKKSGE